MGQRPRKKDNLKVLMLLGRPVTNQSSSLSTGVALETKFRDVIYYNCGEPGHYVELCTRMKRCFIYSKPGHHMDNFPVWYIPMPTTQYWRCANTGLGFFHVEVEEPTPVQGLNMDNVGIVMINEGEILEQELDQNFNENWEVKWFWKIGQLSGKTFLERFPPSKRIKVLVEYPSINLKKRSVNVSFLNWEEKQNLFTSFRKSE
jgi:hypothetical protein